MNQNYIVKTMISGRNYITEVTLGDKEVVISNLVGRISGKMWEEIFRQRHALLHNPKINELEDEVSIPI